MTASTRRAHNQSTPRANIGHLETASILLPPDTLGDALARIRKAATCEKNNCGASAATLVETPALSVAASPSRPSKIGNVLDLLRRDNGVTMNELIAATGWLPHTTRAALTGLRKKGHCIVRSKRGDISCYMLAAEAAA